MSEYIRKKDLLNRLSDMRTDLGSDIQAYSYKAGLYHGLINAANEVASGLFDAPDSNLKRGMESIRILSEYGFDIHLNSQEGQRIRLVLDAALSTPIKEDDKE